MVHSLEANFSLANCLFHLWGDLSNSCFLMMCSLLLPYSLKGEVQSRILQFPYYSKKKKWFFTFLKTSSWNCQFVYNLLTPLEVIWKYVFVLLSSVQSVQSLSHVRFFVTPWTAACQASLSFTISWSLLKLMSIKPIIAPSPKNEILRYKSKKTGTRSS